MVVVVVVVLVDGGRQYVQARPARLCADTKEDGRKGVVRGRPKVAPNEAPSQHSRPCFSLLHIRRATLLAGDDMGETFAVVGRACPFSLRRAALGLGLATGWRVFALGLALRVAITMRRAAARLG